MRRSNPPRPPKTPATERYSQPHDTPNDDPNGNGDGHASPSRFTTPVVVSGAESLKSFNFGATHLPSGGADAPYTQQVPTLPHPNVAPFPAPVPRPHGGKPRPHSGGGGFDRPIPVPVGHPRPSPQKNTCPQNQFAADHSLFGSKDHWWQNWPKTHAYVAKMMFFPKTVDEVSAAIRMAETDGMPVRAVGGGWSFSGAALPGSVGTLRPGVPVADQIVRWLPMAEGFSSDITVPSVALIDPTDPTLISYDAKSRMLPAGLQMVPAAILDAFVGGAQPQPVYLINTRSIKSCLQEHFAEVQSDEAKKATSPLKANPKHYFHVEAGITIEELRALLDLQSPRLSLDASSGNPGSTIAGSLATGTHGAENNNDLLVDRVKAIHIVGPGGLQWWIEGDDSIADPDALLAKYPCLDRSRIIAGKNAIDGATPQNWLNAVVVSLGCMGAVYSLVLEVSPLTGMRGIASQTTWWNLLAFAKGIPVTPVLVPIFGPGFEGELRLPASSAVLGGQVAMVVTQGTFSTLLDATIGPNMYANLAFNPNRRGDGDFDCWIVNHQNIPLPFDPQPPSPDGLGAMMDAVTGALMTAFNGDPARLVARFGQVYGFIDPVKGVLNQLFNPFAQIASLIVASLVPGITGVMLSQLMASADPFPIVNLLRRIGDSADTLDVALDAMTEPLTRWGASDLAQPLLTGVLAGMFGTGTRNPNVAIGTSVGSVGFPNSGIVGTGIEIALPVSSAFQFLQTQILDKMNPALPFFGYVSVRLCKSTKAFLGMPQWGNPLSVMIEVVSIGDTQGLAFVLRLQADTLNAISAGTLDAMLHWGLENDLLSAAHLASTPTLNIPTTVVDPANPGVPLNKLMAFKRIRDLIRSANGSNAGGLFRTFDNNFTTRLGL